MINRNVLNDINAIKNFDHFNDYIDTMKFLAAEQNRIASIATQLSVEYDKWRKDNEYSQKQTDAGSLESSQNQG